MKISFSPPDIGEMEIEEVVDTLKSGWITTGPKTKELERQVAEFCGVSKAVCLNSATACLEMTLRLLGIGEGDEVITSAYTYTASASVVYHIGAKLVLVDTAKDSFQMDLEQLEQAITPKTKAIIPVDIAGIMCEYDEIFDIVDRQKLKFTPNNEMQKAIGRIAVVADSAHGYGAKYKGKSSGSVADFTTFSFHAVKNFTTAEGGAVTWRPIKGFEDDYIYKQYMLLSLHGQSKDALAKTKIGAWEYDIIMPAYKCNMTDIMAAIGLAQMKRYPGMLNRRKELISRYNKTVDELNEKLKQMKASFSLKYLDHYNDQVQSSGHLYLLRMPGLTEKDRNEMIIHMAENEVATNVHYKPLPMLSAYKNHGFDIMDYPNAYAQYSCEMTLPLHTCLTDEQMDYILATLTKVIMTKAEG